MSTLLWFCSLFRRGAPSPSSGAPPSAFKNPVPDADKIVQTRKNFCSKRKSDRPSNGGYPRNFLPRQYELDQRIACNRPHGLPAELPLSLLHPVFGEFVDDAENYVPTPNDVPFFLEFVQAMANVYKVENKRRETVLTIFQKYNMHINPTSIGEFRTDGDLSSGKFRYLIFEFKNEIGATGAEPFFQAILYYLEATRKFAGEHHNSVLPCIIVLIFGALSFLDPSFIYLMPFRPLHCICRCCMDWSSDHTDAVLCHPMPLSRYRYQDGEHASAPRWSSPTCNGFSRHLLSGI